MLDAKTIRIAKENGIYDKIVALQKDLHEIKFVTDVDFDLDNYIDIPQVIFLLKYDIRANRNDYWSARKYVCGAAIEIAEYYGLKKTEDKIEDYGEHFYFVFSARRWKNENNPAQKGV